MTAAPATGAADRVDLPEQPKPFTGPCDTCPVPFACEWAGRCATAEAPAALNPPSSGAGAAGLEEVEAILARIDHASLGMIGLHGAEWDRANEDHIAAVGQVRRIIAALRATIARQADDLERLRGMVEPAPVRGMIIAYAHSVCSAAAYSNTSVEHRWLRDRWLAALDALGLTEEQARNECRAAMRGIYAARPSADQREGADEGGGRG